MDEQTKMKAWKVIRPGLNNFVFLKNEPLPTIINDYQIIIKNLAVGLNPVDYKWAEREENTYPYIPGLDGCGIVFEVGTKVDPSYSKGRLVYWHGSLKNKNGYFAEYVVHDSRYLTIVPETIYSKKNIQEIANNLAAIPCAGFTAYQIICDRIRLPLYKNQEYSNFKSFKNIMITGGAGGVGGFCLQLLKIWKSFLPEEKQKAIKIITTCSSNNFDYVKSLGATHAIDYKLEDTVKKVMDLTYYEGVDVWVENVGGDDGLCCLSFAGEFVSVVDIPKGGLSMFANDAKSFHAVMLGAAYFSGLPEKIEEIKLIGDKMLELYSQNKINSLLSEVIPFEKIKDYLIKLKGRHVRGKIVATLNNYFN